MQDQSASAETAAMEIDEPPRRASRKRKHEPDFKANDDQIEPSQAKKQNTGQQPDSYYASPLMVKRRDAVHSVLSAACPVEMTLDLSNLITNLAFGDNYATKNSKFRSLILRRDVIYSVISRGRPLMPMSAAAFISEYSLLPPNMGLDCAEEKLAFGPDVIRPWVLESGRDYFPSTAVRRVNDVEQRELESVWFRWARSVSLARGCNLIIMKSFIPNPDLQKLFEENPALNFLARPEAQVVEQYNPDQLDLSLYPYQELRYGRNVVVASMSFYYRECTRNRCRCAIPCKL